METLKIDTEKKEVGVILSYEELKEFMRLLVQEVKLGKERLALEEWLRLIIEYIENEK